MEFGEWLRDQHQRRKLDVRTLAEVSRIDPSTISRIENLHTQPTLCTAYRICNGLNVPFSQLYKELVGIAFNDPKGALSSKAILTLDDMDVLLKHYALESEDLFEYFSQSFNSISMSMSQRKGGKGDLGINPQFTTENMKALLSGKTQYLFHFDLIYPQNIESDIILSNYYQDGVLILDDVGAYARGLRRLSRETLREVESDTDISKSVLSRFEEGTLERIKLSDVLKLDESLKQYGTLMYMCWRVCRFDEQIDQILRSHFRGMKTVLVAGGERLVPIYIRVCRWFQYIEGVDSKWSKYEHQKKTVTRLPL